MLKTLIVVSALLAVAYGVGFPAANNFLSFNTNRGANCGARPLYQGPKEDFIPDYRVVGGNMSVTGDHCWHVIFLYNGALRCGGSIINSVAVLNAAHCSVNTNNALISFDRVHTRNAPETWRQTRQCRGRVDHPSYSGSTYNNDISVLFLAVAFNFDGTYVCAICLGEWAPPDNERSIATGFGSTQSGGAVVQVLREMYCPITTLAAVLVQYGNAYNAVTMIGACYQGDGLDTCQGDSGGPISVACDVSSTNANAKKICQVGIVSWGYGCGGIGIYSRVETYLAWIEASCVANNAFDSISN